MTEPEIQPGCGTGAEQVAKQCEVVAHMATVLAKVCADYAMLLRLGKLSTIMNLVGDETALQMEILGDMLNGMDAVAEEDDWISPVFSEAQRLWPQAEPCPWCGEPPPQPGCASDRTASNTESSPTNPTEES